MEWVELIEAQRRFLRVSEMELRTAFQRVDGGDCTLFVRASDRRVFRMAKTTSDALLVEI